MLTNVTELLTVFLVFRKRDSIRNTRVRYLLVGNSFYPDDVLCVHRLVDHHDGAGA
jgi:hypothetical protein